MSDLKIFSSMVLLNEDTAKHAAQYDGDESIKLTVELIVRVYNYQASTNKKTLKLNIIKKG